MNTNLTMKKVLLVLALTLMAFTAKAQLYTGGSIQFLGVGNDGAVFGVAPEVGYSFNQQMAVGTSLGLLFGGGGALSIDPYFRYHFVNWGPVRFFADAHLNFSTAFDGSGAFWGIGVRPGATVNIDDHFSLVTHIMRIGYYGGSFVAGINSSLSGILSLSPILGVYYTF